jgi:hypothetical protein
MECEDLPAAGSIAQADSGTKSAVASLKRWWCFVLLQAWVQLDRLHVGR